MWIKPANVPISNTLSEFVALFVLLLFTFRTSYFVGFKAVSCGYVVAALIFFFFVVSFSCTRACPRRVAAPTVQSQFFGSIRFFSVFKIKRQHRDSLRITTVKLSYFTTSGLFLYSHQNAPDKSFFKTKIHQVYLLQFSRTNYTEMIINEY